MDKVCLSEKNTLANVRSFFNDVAPLLTDNPREIIDFIERKLKAIEKNHFECKLFTVVLYRDGFKMKYEIPGNGLTVESNLQLAEEKRLSREQSHSRRAKYASNKKGWVYGACAPVVEGFVSGKSIIWKLHTRTNPHFSGDQRDLEFTPVEQPKEDYATTYRPKYTLDQF